MFKKNILKNILIIGFILFLLMALGGAYIENTELREENVKLKTEKATVTVMETTTISKTIITTITHEKSITFTTKIISISTYSVTVSSFKTITVTTTSTMIPTITTTQATVRTETASTTTVTTTQPIISIYINEVEANPPGGDEGNEWIELYNPNNFDINLKDWCVSTTHGATVTIRFVSEVIPAEGYLIVRYSGQWIDNEDESLELFDSQGRRVDSTPLLNDPYNDNRSWQRVPDGSDNWKFKTATPNASN
jgi:hypothetical protein